MLRTATSETTWVYGVRTLLFWLLALLIVISIGALLVAKPARAETFTVNSTGDGGDAAPVVSVTRRLSQSGPSLSAP